MVGRGRFLLDGVPVDILEKDDLLAFYRQRLVVGGPKLITYLNTHQLALALADREYREILLKFDLVYADGWGPIWILRLKGYCFPPRMTAMDFIGSFVKNCAKDQTSLFLLGGKNGVAEKAASVLKKGHSRLRVVDWANGFEDLKTGKQLIAKIKKVRPKILLVALGSPKQEKWAYQHARETGVDFIWCVGGLFDYLAGGVSRCPSTLGRLGLEWLYRLLAEPKRLGKRYAKEIFLFLSWLGDIRVKQVKKTGKR